MLIKIVFVFISLHAQAVDIFVTKDSLNRATRQN